MIMHIENGKVFDLETKSVRTATLAELLQIIKESQFYASLNNEFYERQLEMGRENSAAKSLDSAAYFYRKVDECIDAIAHGQYIEVNPYDI